MRWSLAWIGCALALAAVACEGEPAPPGPASAEPGPAATAAVQPAATATATPTATSSPTPASAQTPRPTPTRAPTPSPTASPGPTPSPTPEPTPEPTPTATPEPSPTALPIESTPIARGDPRPLPAGLALYYWVVNCMPCDSGPTDLRRIILDEAADAFREDRPLASFDVEIDGERYSPVGSFGVSKSGQTLAATVCHTEPCEVDFLVGGHGPSAETELRLWVTRDGGATWEDWGELLPQTWIIEVTDDDVLVETWNIWGMIGRWDWLTDAEWDEMLERFAPLGLDQLDGWEKRARWVVSRELPTLPAAQSPPTVEGVEDWYRLDDQPTNAVAWVAGWPQYTSSLALTDESGVVERIYSSTDSFGGVFIADDLLAANRGPYGVEGAITTLDLIDLTTATVHEVDGLSLPFGFEPGDERQPYEFYHLITARPAPAPPAK